MLHYLLNGFSPNVPSFFATYCWKMFLHNFIMFYFPSFSARPRRHVFYLGICMVLVHTHFSKTSIFMRSNFEHYQKAGLFSHHFSSMLMIISASISVTIVHRIVMEHGSQHGLTRSLVFFSFVFATFKCLKKKYMITKYSKSKVES